MPDPSARDRAIRVVGGAIVPGHWPVEVSAAAAVDALCAAPDVLAALAADEAGTATPDDPREIDAARDVIQAARFWRSKRDRLQYPPPRLSSAPDAETCSLPEARVLYDAVAALDSLTGANKPRPTGPDIEKMRLVAQVLRVRTLHTPDRDGDCVECDGYDGKNGGRKVGWPCPTTLAVNAGGANAEAWAAHSGSDAGVAAPPLRGDSPDARDLELFGYAANVTVWIADRPDVPHRRLVLDPRCLSITESRDQPTRLGIRHFEPCRCGDWTTRLTNPATSAETGDDR